MTEAHDTRWAAFKYTVIAWCIILLATTLYTAFYVVTRMETPTMDFVYPEGDHLSFGDRGDVEYTPRDDTDVSSILPFNMKGYFATPQFMIFDLGASNNMLFIDRNSGSRYLISKGNSLLHFAKKHAIVMPGRFNPVWFYSYEVLTGYGEEHDKQ